MDDKNIQPPAPAADPVADFEAATVNAAKASAAFALAVIAEAQAYKALLSGDQLERAAHFLALKALAEANALTQECGVILDAARAVMNAAK